MIDWIRSFFTEGFITFGDGFAIIGDYYFRYPEALPQLTPLSIWFIAFVFIVFCLVRPFKGKLRPFVLLAADLFFLFSFSLYHMLFLLGLSAVAWILCLLIYKYRNRILLYVSVLIPVGILCFYKYPMLNGGSLIMPLGLSFVSFKIISSLIDTYKGKADTRNPLTYLNYALFFPAVTAGPIHRYAPFREVLENDQSFDYRDAKNGGFQMMLGIFEKMVFCDFIASVVTRALGEGMTGWNSVLAIVLYSSQIYLDFDAYSNISIGCARLLGFKFEKNFNSPYLSSSIKEFWRRWHISLGAFFRDYVYIPLGGSRKGRLRQYLAILTVFLLSGIWHGSTWNFVLWGFGHAVLQIIEEPFISRLKKRRLNKGLSAVLKVFGIAFNFILVTILWQLFRYSDLNALSTVLNNVLTGAPLDMEAIGLTHNEVIWLICVLTVTVIFDILRDRWDMLEKYASMFLPLRWIGYIVLMFIFLIFGVYGGSFAASDFIYQWF